MLLFIIIKFKQVPTIQEQRNNQNNQALSPNSSLRLIGLAQASSYRLGESSTYRNSNLTRILA